MIDIISNYSVNNKSLLRFISLPASKLVVVRCLDNSI